MEGKLYLSRLGLDSVKDVDDDNLLDLAEMVNSDLSDIITKYGDYIRYRSSDDENSENGDENEDTGDDDPCDAALGPIYHLTRKLLKFLGPKMFDFWEKINSNVIIMSECINPTPRHYAITMYSHVFHYMPIESVTLTNRVIGNIIRALEDENELVHSSALECVGSVSKYAGSYYREFLEFSLSIIEKSIRSCRPWGTHFRDEWFDLAVATIAKIMKFCPEIILEFDIAVEAWISFLPVIDENFHALKYLLELTETKFESVAGPGNSRLLKVLGSLVSMMQHVSKRMDRDLNTRSLKALKRIRNYAPDTFDVWFEGLESRDKKRIGSTVSFFDNIPD